jgi:hypothetical protein
MQSFNDVSGVNYPPYFLRKFEEWAYHIPVIFPTSYGIWVFLSPLVLEFTKLF